EELTVGLQTAITMAFTHDEKRQIHDLITTIKSDQVGAESLTRLMIVYGWTKRYFKKFGNLATCDAIQHNASVAAHGAKVFKSIVEASKHMDDLKSFYADLSTIHCKTLFVDTANFELFCGITSVVMGMTLGEDYTCQRQASWEKFMRLIGHALSSSYH
ncbi:hemoglobin beta-like protein, partial [Escherichia coli]|uniref:hemoglobin beta-like protein n=1 Tax=Escherichia coli TaxID=562 RepID=UPI001584FB13